MAENKHGVARALADLVAGDDQDDFVLHHAEQLELLDGGEELVAEARGRGRPKGSRNKRTEVIANLIMAETQGTSPLVLAARRFGAPPPEILAKRYGLTMKEAVDVNERCLLALANYTDQKQPTAIDFTETRDVHLTLGVPAEQLKRFGIDPSRVIEAEFSLVESEENQEVSPPDPGDLDGADLDAGKKGEENQ